MGANATKVLQKLGNNLASLHSVHLNDAELEGLWDEYDKDHNGYMTLDELGLMYEEFSRNTLARLPHDLDPAKRDELTLRFGSATRAEVMKMFKKMDTNDDGLIHKNEFMANIRAVYEGRPVAAEGSLPPGFHFDNSGFRPVLSYFPGRGRAEEIRLALAVAGVHFTDHRITFEEWPAQRERFPFKAVPALEVAPGLHVAESAAIMLYVADRWGLNPATDDDLARAESVLFGVEDLRKVFFKYRFGRLFSMPADQVSEGMKKYMTETAPRVLRSFEKQLNAVHSAGKGEYLFPGAQLTFADITLYDLLDQMASDPSEASHWTTQYLTLKRFYDTVSAHPAVTAWRHRAPPSHF